MFKPLSKIVEITRLFGKIVAVNETWVSPNYSETKHERFLCKSRYCPRPIKAPVSKSNVQAMLVCSFDIKLIIRYEFFLQSKQSTFGTFNINAFVEKYRIFGRTNVFCIISMRPFTLYFDTADFVKKSNSSFPTSTILI